MTISIVWYCSIWHCWYTLQLLSVGVTKRTHTVRSPSLCDQQMTGIHSVGITILGANSEQSIQRKMLTCEHCDLKFGYMSELNKHLLKHKHSSQFKCGECTKVFRHKRNMKEHFRAQHVGQKFACDICHKSFTYKNTLNRHKATIHRGIQCDKCSEVIESAQYEAHHDLWHKRTTYNCLDCRFIYISADQLALHREKSHN